jgi:aspartate oxidase
MAVMSAIINSIPSFTGGKINKEHLADLLIAGKSAQDAAIAVGCCKSTANRALKLLRDGGVIDTKSKKPEIVRLRESGASYQAIVERTGRSMRYVRTLCWELGMTNHALQNKR